MLLYENEPIGDFRVGAIESLVERVSLSHAGACTVVAIDGRSGGGKTTLARQLSASLGAAMLSTDDFAWWHSLFDWPEMLIENAIAPLRRGESVDYKPQAWIERDRAGSIRADANQFVVVEGVGALQARMRGEVDFGIWVQSDAQAAKERGLLRDAAERPDPAEAEAFWNEWQAAENEFQRAQQSWSSANIWVCGTPQERTIRLSETAPTTQVVLSDSEILVSEPIF